MALLRAGLFEVGRESEKLCFHVVVSAASRWRSVREELLGLGMRGSHAAVYCTAAVRHVCKVWIALFAAGIRRSSDELLVVFESCQRLVRIKERFVATRREHHCRYVWNSWVREIGRQSHMLLGRMLHWVGGSPREVL